MYLSPEASPRHVPRTCTGDPTETGPLRVLRGDKGLAPAQIPTAPRQYKRRLHEGVRITMRRQAAHETGAPRTDYTRRTTVRTKCSEDGTWEGSGGARLSGDIPDTSAENAGRATAPT